MRFKTRYTADKKSKISFKDDAGYTIQEQAAATEISNILARYQKTGIIDNVNENEALYGEFEYFDFQKNQNMIVKLTEAFEELPAQTRKEFDNSVEQFAEYIAKQDGIEDMKDGVIDNLSDANDSTESSASDKSVSDSAPSEKTAEKQQKTAE